MAAITMVTVHAVPIWPLLRDGLIGLMEEMENGPYPDISIIFDPNCEMFTITCHAEDEDGVIEYFHENYALIEQHIEDNEEDIFFETDGVLLGPLPNNPWIGRERNPDQAREFTRTCNEYRFPASFPKFPFRYAWTRLDHFHWLVLKDIVSSEQLEMLQNEYNATIETDICGVEVYLGTQHQHDMRQLVAKLDYLLFLKCVPDPIPAHIFYTEGHKDPEGIENTIDARFMANVDLGLLRTTFLDMGASTDSSAGYHVLANGITLRLCQWDSTLGHAVSYFGPPVKPRKGSTPASTKPFVLTSNSTMRTGSGYSIVGVKAEQDEEDNWPSRMPHTAASNRSSDGSHVEKWLDTVEENPAAYSGSLAASSVPRRSDGVDVAGALPVILQDLLIDLSTANDAHPGEVPRKQTWAELEGLVFGTLDSAASVTSPDATETTSAAHRNRGLLGGNTSSLGESVDTASESHSVVRDEATDTELVFPVGKQYVGRKTKPVSPRSRSRQSLTLARNIPPLVAGSAKASSATSSSRRAGKQNAAELSREIHAAVGQLVKKGPYMRGKVSLRLELGRIVIVGMDYSGLSFNLPGFRSNGWRKSRLLKNFHHAGNKQRLLFSQMLTQDGSDIEFLTKTTDAEHRKPIWRGEAMESNTYSFLCRDETNENFDHFFIDVVHKPDDLGFKYTLRCKENDKAPVWIHGVLRNWDARIAMYHADTSAAEGRHRAFATELVSHMRIFSDEFFKPHYSIFIRSRIVSDIKIVGMRTHTLWRFPSVDGHSYLDITKVEQTAMEVLRTKYQSYRYEFDYRRKPHVVNSLEAAGELSLWYQASISSDAAEKLLAENETIGFGEKAHWDYETLKKEKVIEALYKPGLRMLQLMDSVGAHNDNQQMETMDLPQGNFGSYPEVPGANYVEPSTTKASVAVSEQATASSREEVGQMAPPPGSVRGPVHIQQQRRRPDQPPSVAASTQRSRSTHNSSRLPGPSFW